MWVAGLGLRIYAAVHGWSDGELLNPPLTSAGIKHYPVEAGVAALGVVISLCICLVYALLVRLLGWRTGIIGGCLLALDPFYLKGSKVLHVDAMLATTMLVSALFLVSFLHARSRSHLLLSGAFAGLAFLTKSPAWFLIPYAVLITILHHLADRGHISTGSSEIRTWGRRLWEVTRSLGGWGLVAGCVFFLLWPAMWTAPVETMSRVAEQALFHAKTPHPNPNFFAGQVVDGDPGPLYYVATLAWKTTLITLPAIGIAILFLLRRRKCGVDCRPLWYVLMYIGGFLLMMMLAAKKWSRYILPAFIALDVLAAWGLVQVAGSIGRRGRLQERTWIPAPIITVALIAQAVAVLRHHPYYGTHHNLLLGGSRVAQYILPLCQEGEGLDLAARFLNDCPGAELITAGVQDVNNEMFRSNFVGHARSIGHPDADYHVFFINARQRKIGIDHWGGLWESCQQTGPLWSVSFDGVPYVWICRAYPHDPEAFAIDDRVDAQFGDHIHLLGYRLSLSDLSAGDVLTVTLFWQSDGQLHEDYHVFVHLLDTDNLLAAQHDGVPVHRERPTWSWQDMEVLQDEHMLLTDVGLPGGTYTLSVGMYDYPTMVRLPAIGPAGERLPEDRIVLQEIRVNSP